jgi:hypothetical protein
MGMPAPSAAANAAYGGILHAAQRGEVQALKGRQGGLPGVNLDTWFDGNAEETSESQMLNGNRFADSFVFFTGDLIPFPRETPPHLARG